MENESRYTITLDDDPTVSKLISRATGILSLPFTSAAALKRRASSYDPIAAFIDINLDFGDCGLDVIPDLRNCWPHTPIIVVTSDPKDDFVGQALASGANDFVRKPISPAEICARFVARVSEMRLRKKSDIFSVADVTFCVSKSVVQKDGKVCYLPHLEAQLLTALLESRGMVLKKDELKRRLWGSIIVSDNALDKKISSIRKAFVDVGSAVFIKSIYGQGVVIQDENYSEP